MKTIKLKREYPYVADGKYFYVRASDMVDALKELLMYYSGDTEILPSGSTLTELLALARSTYNRNSKSNIVLSIRVFNFLNDLFKKSVGKTVFVL